MESISEELWNEIIQYLETADYFNLIKTSKYFEFLKTSEKINFKFRIKNYDENKNITLYDTIKKLSINEKDDKKYKQIINLDKYNLSNLSKLSLRYLKIYHEKNINLDNLKCLDINHCNIENNSLDFINNLLNLKKLRLYLSKKNRCLEKLNFKFLERLELSRIDINLITYEPSKNLKTIRLSFCNIINNNFSKFIKNSLMINKIYLTHIKNINNIFEFIEKFDYLKKFRITYSRLKNVSLKSIENSINLKSLVTSQIRSKICLRYSNLINLKELDLYFVDICDEYLEDMKHLINLKILNLRRSKLNDRHLNIIRNLINLENINLSTNYITIEGLKIINNFKKLKELNISYNKNIKSNDLICLRENKNLNIVISFKPDNNWKIIKIDSWRTLSSEHLLYYIRINEYI